MVIGNVRAPNERNLPFGRTIAFAVALLFFLATTWASYARWANFQYRTFDLAYYVQAVWQLIHGRFQVSVEDVPLLGNHVEPIVFLFAPLFAVFRHPMLFVVVQNAALAAMAPIGYNIARRLGGGDLRAGLLSVTILIAPAAGFVALHEFHPEALAAPFLLLLLQARLTESRRRYWFWFIAVLACKENMALLLSAYCAVQAMVERKQGWAHLRRWYLVPLVAALGWFAISTQLITPALNAGNIDYLALYDRLGSSPLDILGKAFTEPQRIGRALFQSLTQGNLLWGLFVPFLFLPLRRPRWLLIAAPILLQHLLSWRSSEWMIYFHYGAPLLPIFWFAMIEALAPRLEKPSLTLNYAIGLILIAGIFAQFWLGAAAEIGSANAAFFKQREDRLGKQAFIDKIPDRAGVVAPLPYLSHLATREKLYSLHYILKGLKTLSRQSYEPPPPPEFVLIDYLDSSTFDPGAGYYHPTMKTVDGRVVPSSDRLLHNFLKRACWTRELNDELALLRRADCVMSSVRFPFDKQVFELADHTILLAISKSSDTFSKGQPFAIELQWNFPGEREIFPWMILRLRNAKGAVLITKGLCAPESIAGLHQETWNVKELERLPAGGYSAEALFIDNTKRAQAAATGGGNLESTLLVPPIPLGQIQVVGEGPAR